jgi:acetate kinase
MISAHTASSPNRELVVVLNCGSSSIKFAVFDGAQRPLPRQPLWNGKVQGIGGPAPDFGETGVAPFAIALDAAHPYRAALQLIRERITARLGQLQGARVSAVAHRVVHGGSRYFEPVRVDAGVLADLKAFIPLAPLHQLPLPHAAWERGLRRYGFHGLSYEYMATALPERHGELARGRTLVAHLGSGASLCAMQGLQSVGTTMGFSALDGLMMGTRTGALDPGAVIYLMEIEKLSLAEVGRILYHESGLLGVSGTSSEPRVLLPLESGDDAQAERARDALGLYVRRIVREIGALVAVLGGLDLLVFTAGVGEHSAEIRRRVCEGLGFLGLRLDAQANAADAAVISAPGSAVTIGVEPTNEEWVAARHALRWLPG